MARKDNIRDADSRKRARELEALIKFHQNLYYNDEPIISDAEFDALWDELKGLEPRNALFSSIGEDASDRWPKYRHRMTMGSLSKATDLESFRAWAEKVRYSTYLVQYKLDGASLELQYDDGNFVRGVTRGDGLIGDDITQNVLRMHGVPQKLPSPFTGAVRGEVLMSKSVHKEKYSDKANCRNAANGIMKRKDGMGSENLDIICYDAMISFPQGEAFRSEREKIAWIERMGFSVVTTVECRSCDEVIAYRAKIMDLRSSLDYDIDGLVVKGDLIDAEDSAKLRPELQIAFKFSPEEAITTLLDVEWSESGTAVTPIGIVAPVKLAGTSVKRANLANPGIIRAMDLRLGSKVIIAKRGEIIPKIESLVENPPHSKAIIFPTNCTLCKSELVDDGTRLYCPNSQCPGKAFHRLEKWISVIDIKDFGSAILKKLFDAGRVRRIPDIYTLQINDFLQFERMGEKIAQKILRNIKARNEITFSQFIAGFDIEGIGILMADKLVSAGFASIEALCAAQISDFEKIDGFAEITSRTFYEGIRMLEADMRELIEKGYIKIKSSSPSLENNNAIAGKSFCFTGELNSMKRSEAENLVREKGGFVKSAVTRDLNFLVTNDVASGSEKNKKAREYSISIIDEAEFLAMVRKETQHA